MSRAMTKENFYFQSNEEPREIIASIFGMDLAIGNGWGYEKSNAMQLYKSDIPQKQTEHTLASMRTHLEMSITQPKEKKYGGINLNEIAREEFGNDKNQYHKVTYAVTAMLESHYNNFIDEYKEKYGKEDFDMAEYFQRRREATINREIIYWFSVVSL